jgi:hypothetical protein
MKIILLNLEPDEWVLGIRAAKLLHSRFEKDIIVSYGEGETTEGRVDLYAKRNKASITVRHCRG